MSRVDLDHIQAQLKVAIQSHQILVAKMKGDPQNTGLQKQLHELQSEITSLSERQKSIVQLLRKELVNKQAGHVTSQSQVLTPAPAHQPLRLTPVSRVTLPPPQTAPTNLCTKPVAAYVINNNNNNTVLTSHTSLLTSPKPAHTHNNNTHSHNLSHNGQLHHAATPPPPLSHPHPQPTHPQPPSHTPPQQQLQSHPPPHQQPHPQPHPQPQPQPTPQSHTPHQQPRPLLLPPHPQPPPLRSPPPPTGSTMPTVTSSGGVLKTRVTQLVTAAPVPRTGSPPIRVPNYSRPSILQVSGRRTPVMRAVSVAPPVRKPSDSDITDVKRASIDRKQLSPEERKKQEYMACLDLVTHDTLKELQSKRSERKRRSTANPQFSYGHFEPERKRGVVHYLANTAVAQGPKKRGRPPKHRPPSVAAVATPSPAVSQPAPPAATPEQAQEQAECDAHEDYCAVCQRSGELLMCDTCNLVYHLQCLEPPLSNIPQGLWSCPKCVALNKNTNNWTGTLALVHSYLAQKTAKEEEKRKLQKRKEELSLEKLQLEAKVKQLTDGVTGQIKRQTELVAANKTAQMSVDKLKAFIKFFQSS